MAKKSKVKRKAAKRAAKPKRGKAKPKKLISKRKAKKPTKKAAKRKTVRRAKPAGLSPVVGVVDAVYEGAKESAALREKLAGHNTFED